MNTWIRSRRARTVQVLALTEAIDALGLDEDAFLNQAGIDRHRLADPYGWFEHDELDRLTALAVDYSGTSAFGLRWGMQSMMLQYDVVAMLIAQTPSLRGCLEIGERFHPILLEHRECTLLEQGPRARIVCDAYCSSPVARLARSEMIVCGMVRLLRYCGVGAHELHAVRFDYPAPPHADEYRTAFGDRVQFDAPRCEIEFDSATLDRHKPHRNPEAYRALLVRAEQLLAEVRGDPGIAQRVEQLLAQRQPPWPALADAATALRLSERTLRRRLQQEGLTYSDMLDRHLSLRARQLLTTRPRLSLERIAERLGFSSASGFHRAFKRWTGVPPHTYRQGEHARQLPQQLPQPG